MECQLAWVYGTSRTNGTWLAARVFEACPHEKQEKRADADEDLLIALYRLVWEVPLASEPLSPHTRLVDRQGILRPTLMRNASRRRLKDDRHCIKACIRQDYHGLYAVRFQHRKSK
jgi:hypothetical protein